MGKKLWGVWLLSYIFYEVWLICFRMIYIIEIHPIMLHWAALFSKLNVKSHFVPLSGTCIGRGIVNETNFLIWRTNKDELNRSPMWPSLCFKPFATKKQHGFVYMMILDNHLNNSLSFSSCVPSHHHWHKSTVALLNIVWFCARCSQMLTEMCGWAGDKFVHWMSQVPTRKRYQSVNVLTGIAIPQPDSSPTAHQSMCWLCNVDKAPTRHGHALVMRTLRRMVMGTCGNGAK